MRAVTPYDLNSAPMRSAPQGWSGYVSGRPPPPPAKLMAALTPGTPLPAIAIRGVVPKHAHLDGPADGVVADIGHAHGQDDLFLDDLGDRRAAPNTHHACKDQKAANDTPACQPGCPTCARSPHGLSA